MIQPLRTHFPSEPVESDEERQKERWARVDALIPRYSERFAAQADAILAMQDADGEMPTERDRELVPKVVGAAGAITHDELSRGVWLHAKRREVAHQYPSADFRAWLCLASLQFDEQYDSVASLARVLASAELDMEQAARKGLA